MKINEALETLRGLLAEASTKKARDLARGDKIRLPSGKIGLVAAATVHPSKDVVAVLWSREKDGKPVGGSYYYRPKPDDDVEVV